MGISADYQVAGDYQSLFGQENVLNASPADIVKADLMLSSKFPATLNYLSALDILGRRKVIHHHDNFFRIEDTSAFNFLELFNGQDARKLGR
jgi:hypothetical protein